MPSLILCISSVRGVDTQRGAENGKLEESGPVMKPRCWNRPVPSVIFIGSSHAVWHAGVGPLNSRASSYTRPSDRIHFVHVSFAYLLLVLPPPDYCRTIAVIMPVQTKQRYRDVRKQRKVGMCLTVPMNWRVYQLTREALWPIRLSAPETYTMYSLKHCVFPVFALL